MAAISFSQAVKLTCEGGTISSRQQVTQSHYEDIFNSKLHTCLVQNSQILASRIESVNSCYVNSLTVLLWLSLLILAHLNS